MGLRSRVAHRLDTCLNWVGVTVPLTRSTIEAMAPDQSALTAAAGLLKPAKWPVRAAHGHLIWGECQGSGANPYRVTADIEDIGYKCTCPSRKFPCKHALALMWMHVDDAGAFQQASVPDWVQDWMGRRRKGGAPALAASAPATGKSLEEAQAVPVMATPADPEMEARRRFAAQRRAVEKRAAVEAGLEELETWISDQLKTGIVSCVGDPGDRCRRIAARLVDAKASVLASRLDELPARLLGLPADERPDAAIMELGRLVLLGRCWRKASTDPELCREIIAAESREDVISSSDTLRVVATWEVLGEIIETRRDGLISQSTWLLNVDPHVATQRFALLLDHFPASAGRRSGSFVLGDRFEAEIAFYPGRRPLRAVLVSRRNAGGSTRSDWPQAPVSPLEAFAAEKRLVPWRIDVPLQLAAGRVVADASGRHWWKATDGTIFGLRKPAPAVALGADILQAVGLWDGVRLDMIAALSNWGRIDFHD